jgi:hypothetical protein
MSNPLPLPGIPFVLPTYRFCIPANPSLGVLRTHAELGLRKLRTGRNIAGMQREVEAYAAPTDTISGMPVAVNGQISLPGAPGVKPTLYRYAVLIARAKEIVQQAAQVEALFTGAVERRDEANYSLLKARQELALTQEQVKLHSLRVTQANNGIKLAQLQRQRAVIEQTAYDEWISAGLNEYELLMVEKYDAAAQAKRSIAATAAAALTAQAAVTAATAGVGAGAAAAAAAVVALSAAANANASDKLASAELDIQIASINASYARKEDDWKLRSALAAQDALIGVQNEANANDQLQIVQQEKSISELQSSFARHTIEYLSNRFTNADLWDWMSGVLSGVYRVLLQQSTVVAQLAAAQLTFERQEPTPTIIQRDYWSAAPVGANGAPGEDRQGLTGSARLLADLYRLDQFAFDTKKRKLAVTKTFSLAQTAPAEFQRFRETGVIAFNTPMGWFDRDFPGHYLRLVRQVRTSIIALIPPVDGIHATLSSTGISRVVVGPEIFQTVTIHRDPETVALSAPIGSNGVFDLGDGNEMYLPFEGNGVDGGWELRLPKAANRWDFRTLADVLISVDFLALQNFDYRQQIIQKLNPNVEAELAFSFRNRFPDAWFDLHNPRQFKESEQMIVRVRIERDDFPAHFEGIKLQAVTLYFSRADGVQDEFEVAHLKQINLDGGERNGGTARTIDGAISTRRGNGAAWLPLTGASAAAGGQPPFGAWELSLRTADVVKANRLKELFETERIEDILLIIGYAAQTPAWPA